MFSFHMISKGLNLTLRFSCSKFPISRLPCSITSLQAGPSDNTRYCNVFQRPAEVPNSGPVFISRQLVPSEQPNVRFSQGFKGFQPNIKILLFPIPHCQIPQFDYVPAGRPFGQHKEAQCFTEGASCQQRFPAVGPC